LQTRDWLPCNPSSRRGSGFSPLSYGLAFRPDERGICFAVKIGAVLRPREAVEEFAFGIDSQRLDRLGYGVTMMSSKTAQLCLGLNADEELDAILGTVNAEMALAITALFLGCGQCHDNAPRRGVRSTMVTP